MNTVTVISIQNSEKTLEVLHQFGIEIELENILAEELELGLASDISSAF